MKILSFILTFFFIAQNSFAASGFNWKFSSEEKRNYLHLVGSSTVSPFMAAVSEEFSRERALKNLAIQTPVAHATGTVGGFKLFCGGIGYKYPDIVGASRAIDESEIINCHNNGVKDIVAVKIGYDGIVIANAKGGKNFSLTKHQIFLALAEKIYDPKTKKIIANPYKNWNEIDAKLPKTPILFYGPPATSGTRDVFVDMIMEGSCKMQKEFVMAYADYNERKAQCHKIRNDGVFVESGENDDNIVRSLKQNPQALGIFGFNFLVVNPNAIQPVKIEGLNPTYQNISSKAYELSRPLYIYFKKEHLDLIPYMRDFITEIVNPETIGRKGYLVHNGLVAMGDEELERVRSATLSEL
jgi:phosphate transport system substrate-binding protein